MRRKNYEKTKGMCRYAVGGRRGEPLTAPDRLACQARRAIWRKVPYLDFTLSNCANSGIDTIGILTQYKPWALNEHVGIGKAWDLDVYHGGVSVLPPYMSEAGGDWYKGTADAIYQNLDF